MTEQPEDMTEQPEHSAANPPGAARARVPHRHRILIGALFALGTIIGLVAVLAVWANRQALNADNWANTSSQLLANKQIQTAVAGYTVNQLFSSGVVQSDVKSALPAQFQKLAGPIDAGLQQLAGQAAPKLLASPQVQTAWRNANHAADAALIKIIDGGGSAVATNGGVVTLNLHALVSQLATTLGIQQQVAGAQSKLQSNSSTVKGAADKAGVTLPPSNGQLVIMRSSQLKAVQNIGSAIKGLALVLPLVAFALFILAVQLSKGHRRPALRMTGWCFVGIGVAALLARRVLGNYIVDSLVKTASNKPAGHDVWSIGTTMLYDIATALVVFGLLLVVAAWLAGHTRLATALRRALAPTLRDRPAVAYGTVYVALLLVIAWGPTPATRQLGYIAAFAVLLTLGVHALRRQTAREFPDAQAGDTMQSIRGRHDDGGQAATRAPVATAGNGSRLSSLERLARLNDTGFLTDAEFAAEKAALTDGA